MLKEKCSSVGFVVTVLLQLYLHGCVVHADNFEVNDDDDDDDDDDDNDDDENKATELNSINRMLTHTHTHTYILYAVLQHPIEGGVDKSLAGAFHPGEMEKSIKHTAATSRLPERHRRTGTASYVCGPSCVVAKKREEAAASRRGHRFSRIRRRSSALRGRSLISFDTIQ